MTTLYNLKENFGSSLQRLKEYFCFIALLCGTLVSAEGSINLYPNGATQGSRAYLVSGIGTYGVALESYPFTYLGDHFVYVKAGETIRAASSAQGVANGQIIFTAPDGAAYSSTVGSNVGKIANRAQEVAGPGTGTNQYSTFNRTATAAQQGIWKVQFIAPGGRNAGDPGNPTSVLVNANWAQATSGSQITAWDVSVINSSNTLQPGRTYFNQLNLLLNYSNFPSTNSFYSTTYAMTYDGYLYRVKGNGYNGLAWIFFVNNKGLVDSNNNPSYKSLNSSSYANVVAATADPRTADNNKGITHKMFYVRPDFTMPATSIGTVPGTTANVNSQGTTWLNPPQVSPTISALSIEGVEGTVNQMAVNKGIYIKFNTNVGGSYNIKINATAPANFQQVTLTGPVSGPGSHVVYWNGKDVNNVVPTPGQQISISATLNAGEVHFPYVDVELNPNGIIIERLDGTQSTDVVEANGDIVYWDDSTITGAGGTAPNPLINLGGLSSNSNGHKWGTYNNNATGDYGNEKTIDTWSYVRSTVTGTYPIVIAQTDLAVMSIASSNATPNPGSSETYTVVVRNNGPYAMTAAKPGTFSFILPNGITGSNSNITFNGNSCGTELTGQELTYNSATNTYNSKLILPSGCSVTYTIGTTVNSTAPIAAYTTTATILRPNDVFDTDGTNPSVYPNFIMPTNPFQECSQWTVGNNCTPANTNNIKTNVVNVIAAVCYDDPAAGTGASTKMGITLLKRASSKPTEWPTVRKSGHLALESNTQGFVINRLNATQMAAIKSAGNAVEGMMVYNTTNNCLSVYSDGDWKCYDKATCP